MKTPPDRPKENDRVKLRGRDAVGVLRWTDLETAWCRCDWDVLGAGPKIVHLNELEKEQK